MTSRTIASIAAITGNMHSRDVSIADLVDMALLRVGCNLKSDQIIDVHSCMRVCVLARVCARVRVSAIMCVCVCGCVSCQCVIEPRMYVRLCACVLDTCLCGRCGFVRTINKLIGAIFCVRAFIH